MLETTNDTKQGSGDIPRSAEEIRNDIESEKEIIIATADQLNERLHETVDWRSHVRKHPFLTLGIAASLGFVVSCKLVKPQAPVEHIADAIRQLTSEPKEQSLIKLILYSVGTKILSDLLKNGSTEMINETNDQRPTGKIVAPTSQRNHIQ